MKFTLFLVLAISTFSFAQDEKKVSSTSKKGSYYVYWGWNRSKYSNSDISFKGNNYDFTLYDVEAMDRQSKFDPNVYLNLSAITIPQYNFRLGYFINEKYSLSFGSDHMKYVMRSYQTKEIDGVINNGSIYDGTYHNDQFNINPDFLKFEHTDGLNYLNLELRRQDKLHELGPVNANFISGVGAGILLPRSNTTLMSNPRYDQFHLAGLGVGAVIALNIEIYKRFFIQTELKGGFIDMPSIRTTMFRADRASQHFSFLQTNVVFGFNFNYNKKK